MSSPTQLITSTDPATGEPIAVAVSGGQATWEPETAVVFVGSVLRGAAGAAAIHL